MAIISLGKINKKILFAIFGGIFKLSADLAVSRLNKVKKNEFRKHPLILGVNAGLGLCLSLIPFLILKKNYDYLNQKKFDSNEKLIFNDADDFILEKSHKRHYQLLIIASCDFGQKFLSFIYIGLDNYWIFDVPFIMLFSYFMLKMKLYKHHFISLILIILFGVVIIVVYNLYKERENDYFFKILNTLVIEILFSLEITIAKYAMEYKFSSPYEICLFDGIFILIVNVILLIIFTFIPFSKINYIKNVEYKENFYLDNFIQYFSQFSFIEAASFIVTMISRFGFTIFCFLTTKYFTPSHIVIILIIGEIFFALEDLDPLWRVFTLYGVYALLIFIMLIFLEIIEINCFGLQKNTEKNIILRANEMELKSQEDELEEGRTTIDSKNLYE